MPVAGATKEKRLRPGLKLPIPVRSSHFLPLPQPSHQQQQQQQPQQQQQQQQQQNSSTTTTKEAWKLPPTSAAAASSELRDVRLEDLQRFEILGQGSGGKVYRARHRHTGALYALKIIQEKHDPIVRKRIIKEMEITRRFCARSPYVVQCYGVFEQGGEISLVLEYMDGGTLSNVLSSQQKIEERYLAEVTRQALKGLMYLHANRIVHRDIKPSNLLLSRRMEVKIADFGVSTELANTLAQCDSFVGTCAYMSPERFDPDGNGGHYDYSADIWSLGLTLLECAIGHFPCLAPGQKADWPTLMWAICMGDPPSPPADASDEFKSFIQRCLQKDSASRPTAAQLLTHPFLTKYASQPSNLSSLFKSLRL